MMFVVECIFLLIGVVILVIGSCDHALHRQQYFEAIYNNHNANHNDYNNEHHLGNNWDWEWEELISFPPAITILQSLPLCIQWLILFIISPDSLNPSNATNTTNPQIKSHPKPNRLIWLIYWLST